MVMVKKVVEEEMVGIMEEASTEVEIEVVEVTGEGKVWVVVERVEVVLAAVTVVRHRSLMVAGFPNLIPELKSLELAMK